MTDTSISRPSPGRTLKCTTPLPTRTPGVALARELADYPGMQLWTELCELLPIDGATRVYEAAAAAYRANRT